MLQDDVTVEASRLWPSQQGAKIALVVLFMHQGVRPKTLRPLIMVRSTTMS
jgi:hypothetical protein